MERFANREVADITIVDYATKAPLMHINYANTTASEMTGESVYAYGGRNHPKRVTFNGERSGTFTIETQIQTFKLYQMLTGGTMSTSAKFVKREVLTAADGLTLSAVAVDGSVNVYPIENDCGEAMAEITATASTATIKGADGTNKEIPVTALAGAFENGEKYVVYYVEEKNNVTNISISANDFPKAVTIYGETVMKTEGEDLVPYKLIAYKAQPQTNMSFSWSNTGDPQTLTMTFDLMADAQNNDKIMDLIMED